METYVECMKQALEKEFRLEEYPIYTEKASQEFVKPYFYVTQGSELQERKLGNRYRESGVMEIHFFPAGQTPNQQMRETGKRLFDCLECLECDGGLAIGKGMQWAIKDDMLQFSILYQRDIIKPKTPEEYMEEVQIIGKTKRRETTRL